MEKKGKPLTDQTDGGGRGFIRKALRVETQQLQGNIPVEALILYIVPEGLQFFTHLLFGPDFTVQPSPVLWCKVSPHNVTMSQCQCSLFSDVLKFLEHISPEYWSQGPKFGYVM